MVGGWEMTSECDDALVELKAARAAYDQTMASTKSLPDGADVPEVQLNEFEKAFLRRQAAEKRVKEACA